MCIFSQFSSQFRVDLPIKKVRSFISKLYSIKLAKIYKITTLINIVIFDIVAIKRVLLVLYLNSTANVKADAATGSNSPIRMVYRSIASYGRIKYNPKPKIRPKPYRKVKNFTIGLIYCVSNLKFKKSPNNNNDNGIFAPEIVLATLIIVSDNWI